MSTKLRTPRTAAATEARRKQATRRRLVAAAGYLREHGYIVVARPGACPTCIRINDASRKDNQ